MFAQIKSLLICSVLSCFDLFCLLFMLELCECSFLTQCGRVTQICVFNTVKLGTSARYPQCHSTRGNVSRGITPSSTTRVFFEYFLKISVHKNSQRICYKFLKKHSINLINPQATNVIYICIYDISSLRINDLTIILLTWRKW